MPSVHILSEEAYTELSDLITTEIFTDLLTIVFTEVFPKLAVVLVFECIFGKMIGRQKNPWLRNTLWTVMQLIMILEDPFSLGLPVSGHNCHNSHKIAYAQFGDPTAVCRKERFETDIVLDNIVLKMPAAPVNPADINTIQGTYPANLSAVSGNEGVGVVIKAAGAPGNRFEEGDWVIPSGVGTGKAFVNGANEEFIKIPKMDEVSAVTMNVNPCTSFRPLKDFETLKPGDCIIQNSAVGQAVRQLCEEFGFQCVCLCPMGPCKKREAKLLTLLNSDTIVITDEDLRGMHKDVKAQLALNCLTGRWAPPDHKLIPFAEYRKAQEKTMKMKGDSRVKYIITAD